MFYTCGPEHMAMYAIHVDSPVSTEGHDHSLVPRQVNWERGYEHDVLLQN